MILKNKWRNYLCWPGREEGRWLQPHEPWEDGSMIASRWCRSQWRHTDESAFIEPTVCPNKEPRVKLKKVSVPQGLEAWGCFSEDDHWGVTLKEAWQSHPLKGWARAVLWSSKTQFLAGYSASKHYGLWSEGKFKSRDSALLRTISSDLRDVVTGLLFSDLSLFSYTDYHH